MLTQAQQVSEPNTKEAASTTSQGFSMQKTTLINSL